MGFDFPNSPTSGQVFGNYSWDGEKWTSQLTAPVNTVLPVISGTAQVGSTLSTTTGTWTESPTGYTYQWKRGGTNISGATASTYLLVSADNAATITVTVTATNIAGSASATSSGVGPITTPYATWDPATVTAVTLSGGNLVATNTGTTSANQGVMVAAASAKTTGKYYFEVTVTTRLNGIGACIGLCTTASTYSAFANDGTAGVMVNLATGTLYLNGGSGSALAPTPSTGSVIGLAIDLDNRKSWMRLAPSGNWNNSGTANPATNVGGYTIVAGSMVPVVTFGGAGGTANNVDTANFGASAFTGAVPSGFTAGWTA